ncbi:hypothetical protein BCR33DRAFT_781970 [Rhizoclosmatium globosum]|uniref:DNA/RNA polymerase n=1 Tax=Rhizoclosmatium globosum TaxID=329046 RepID=A0A1Y2CQ60_9FUNG|nr:hypothetical protein BCR33DRAFT_781970 [Rhizoclosmatium globosum]|eukprot:ORY48964.1 hypothetical protein BCR33DRAFT_781970 [Rhizoclosmatium globosum]
MRKAQTQCPNGYVAVQWKTDVRGAFRLIPNHPINSSLQIQLIDRIPYADRSKSFGGREGPHDWTSVAHLLAWYAIQHLSLNVYVMMDDFWGTCYQAHADFEKGMKPNEMNKMKDFLHSLGIETSDEKDVWGQKITIVGFEVDIQNQTISLDPKKISEMLVYLKNWIDNPRPQYRQHYDELTGSLNWICNVYFYTKPFMSPIYSQTAGQSRHSAICPNEQTINALSWIHDYIKTAPPQRFLNLEAWTINQADLHVYADATPSGFGIWISEWNEGWWFQHYKPFTFLDNTPLLSIM